MADFKIEVATEGNIMFEEDEPCMAMEEPMVMCQVVSKVQPKVNHDDEDSDDNDGPGKEEVVEQTKVADIVEEVKVDEAVAVEVIVETDVEVQKDEVVVEKVEEFKIMSNVEDIHNQNTVSQETPVEQTYFDKAEFKRQDTIEPSSHDKPCEVLVEVEAEQPNPKNIEKLGESTVNEEVEIPEAVETPKPEEEQKYKEETFVNGDKYAGHFSKDGRRNGKGRFLN